MTATESTGWSAGLRVGGGLAAGTFALAVSFGAYAVARDWPLGLVVAMSVLVFSGSAQFALVTASGGGGLASGIAAGALINARFVPMAVAAARTWRGSRLRRALEGQAVVDGSWVAAQRPEGGFDRSKLIAATLVQWPAWIGGTALGALATPSPDTMRATGLDVVFPCFFLLLLLESVRGRPDHRVVMFLAAGLAATAVLLMPPGPALLVSGLAATLALRGRRPR